MQTRLHSLLETSVQVISDVAINVLIAAPLAYYLYDIKTNVIAEMIFLLTTINFGKSYAIRRYYNIKKITVLNLKAKCDELNQKISSIQEITKKRWDNIDKVIDIFKYGILLLLLSNLVTLFFVILL